MSGSIHRPCWGDLCRGSYRFHHVTQATAELLALSCEHCGRRTLFAPKAVERLGAHVMRRQSA